MSAREEVLARIEAAHRLAPPAALAYADIARDYRTTTDATQDELLDRLADRLVDYRARVRRCTAIDLADIVAAALRDQGVRTVVVPTGLDLAWLSGSGVEVLTDLGPAGEGLTVEALDGVDGVVTACALAVAETGTLVLDGSPGQGRRAVTLVPDYNLCVVYADQVRDNVPQAIADLDLTRPITMISGPSATSDIELDRVEGVHGPRTLEVVLVDPRSNPRADDAGQLSEPSIGVSTP